MNEAAASAAKLKLLGSKDSADFMAAVEHTALSSMAAVGWFDLQSPL